jgi:carbon monoxide dehydrogenase subunit G
MIISETFSLAGPRDRIATLLLDVQSIQTCVPGVTDVTRVADDEYRATLTAQVGPVRSSFQGTVQIDASESPQRLRATARGKDRSSGSMVTVAFDARLDDDGPQLTKVASTADVTIRGRLGSFGTGVIQATAKQMIGEFVSCVNGRLGAAPADGTAVVGDATAAASRPIPVLRTLMTVLWTKIKAMFKRRNRDRESG